MDTATTPESGGLKKYLNYLKNNYWLVIILLVGFFIRWYGIYFDYPQGVNNIWDEIFSVVYLLDVFQYKNLFITSYNYPFLLPWLYAPVLILRIIYIALVHGIFNLNELKNFLVMSGMGQIYIIVRWYSVFFGTATIFLLYKIYGLIFKNRLSLYFLSAAYATSLVPVFLSHWGKAHSVMVFFLVLSLFFVLKFEKEKSLKFFYWSTVAAAASVSIHYIGLSAAIFPLLGFIHNRKLFTTRTLFKAFFLYVIPVVFFYASNYNGIKGMVANNIGYFENTGFTGMSQAGGLERFYYVARDSFNLDPVFIALFVIMLAVKFKEIFKNTLLRYIIFGLLFNYLLMITVIAWPQMSRWLLIFITLAIPLGAGLFMEFLIDKNINRRLQYFIFLFLLIPNLIISGLWLNLLRQNTMSEASAWLQSDLKQNEAAYSFDRYLDAPLSYQAAWWHKENNKVLTAKKINYIIDHKENFLNQGINLRYDYANNRYKDLGGKETKYVIIAYWQSGETNERTNLETRKQAYETLDKVKEFHRLELVQKFYPTADERLIATGIEDYLNNPLDFKTLFHLKKSGPFVEIYQVI